MTCPLDPLDEETKFMVRIYNEGFRDKSEAEDK